MGCPKDWRGHGGGLSFTTIGLDSSIHQGQSFYWILLNLCALGFIFLVSTGMLLGFNLNLKKFQDSATIVAGLAIYRTSVVHLRLYEGHRSISVPK